MSNQASQMKSLIIGCIIIYALGYASATISFHWLQDESPEQAYERGYKEGQLIDSTKPYVTMGIASPSEIVIQIVEGDTLYFWKQQVDTGYILKPLHRVRRTWTPEDSMESCEYEEWFDTSRGWGDKMDSTDTLPAVERDSITARNGLYLLNTE